MVWRKVAPRLGLIMVLVCAAGGSVSAVSEDQMYMPIATTINQGYLYGEMSDPYGPHKGVDIRTPVDAAHPDGQGYNVYAAYGGTVYDFGGSPTEAEGYWVKISHGGGVYTYYCHLK